MENLQSCNKGNADKSFCSVESDQGKDTIQKLSQQTDNLLAVICLLQNQFEAVKRDVKCIKENVAKLEPRENARECRKPNTQVLPSAIHQPVQEMKQLQTGVVESDSSRHYPFSTNVPVFGASSVKVEGTSGSQSSKKKIKKGKHRSNRHNSGRESVSLFDGSPATPQQSKDVIQPPNNKPDELPVHSNRASSESKTENVFDELVNLKNEFQEWRVASSFMPEQLRLEMRQLGSAQKAQELKIDELRRFLNLQTYTFIDQHKILLDEIKKLSQRQSAFSDDLRGLEERVAANQGWNEYKELLDGMSQQNEDICEVMTHVGKQIKELKVQVKKQSPLSWRCDTCTASNPLKVGSQKFFSSNAGSLILDHPPLEGGHSGKDQLCDPHDDLSTFLLESLYLTTGEEGEEEVFKAKGKLFHFDSNIKKWLEVCVGEVKILKNLEIGRTRLLMKTEKLHKICANHWLKPEMRLFPNLVQSSGCAHFCYAWNAVDFAKGEKCHERFSLGFDTQDLAEKFKIVFDKMKTLKKESCGYRVNSKNSYGLRKKLGCVQEGDDESDEDSADSSDQKQSQRWEKSSFRESTMDIKTTRPSPHLNKSPSPASQPLTSNLSSAKPTVTTQSLLAGFKFNRTAGTSLSLASSQNCLTPASTTPETTSSTPSSFTGLSYQTSPLTSAVLPSFGSSKGIPPQPCDNSSTAEQNLKLASPLVGGSNKEEKRNDEPQRPGIFSPLHSSATFQSKSGQTPISLSSSPKTLGLQGQRLDGSPSLATYAAAAGQRPQQPSVMGNQPGSNLLTVPRPTVTSVSTTKPSSHLIKSPTPASHALVSHLASAKPAMTTQSLPASHLASSKPPTTTQSPFAGFSFNKTPGTTSSFASSQTFQIPKSTAPVTTTSSTSPFAGFSFQSTPSKKDTPTLFGSSAASLPANDDSAAQQYPQLTALLVGGSNEEEGNDESPRPGFYAPSAESSQRKPGQSPMGVTSSAAQKKEDKTSTTSLKGNDDNNDDVIFMGEVKATPEQVAKAEKLMLPPSFYLYEQRPPCPGCIGCEEEDLQAKKEDDKPVPVEEKSSSIFPEKAKEPASQTPSFFGNAAISSLSFASLSADGDASIAKKDTSSKPFQFAGAGSLLFGSAKQDDDSVAEDQEYDPHYDPIISLPENVDLTTGDEGQEVVFKERAKLYRYDSDTQAWKERGVGDMKILKDPETGKARILMRMEQVLKVCANHWLTPDMQLLPMSASDRAFVWNAIDFAEGDECHEQLAIKFKTPGLAAGFKEAFDEMKKGAEPKVASAEEKPVEQVEEVKPAASTKEDESEHKFHQADLVVAHPEEGEEDEDYDGDYDGEKDGYEDEEDYYEDDDADNEYEDYEDNEKEEEEEYVEKEEPPKESGGASSLGNFNFSSFSSSPSAFSAGSGFVSGSTRSTPATFSFGQITSQSSNTTPSGSAGFSLTGGFTFAQQKPETTQTSDSGFKMRAASSPFSFTAPAPPNSETQKPSSGFSFGSSPGNVPPTSQASSTPLSSTSTQPGASQATPIFSSTQDESFASAFKGFELSGKTSEPKTEQKDLVKNQGEFSFSLNVDNMVSSPPKSGSKSLVKSPRLNKSGEYYQEERDDIYFEPVVTLPENYKLETGEENEEVKFSQRAKLYRFDVEGSQWKERGVGDIKVLYNPEMKHHRIVMRRDQVLKVCANHHITQHVNLQPNAGSERSWVWQAMDISDGELQNEQLAVRFKTEDAAREFKEVVDEAKKNLPETPEKTEQSTEGQKKNVIDEDQHRGDEKSSKPADEETPEEEKEKDSSREIMFSAPADLSYADEDKCWRLRGKGQFQITFDKDSKNYSVEMKNDKDNSLCAKHLITKGMQLIPVRGQDRSYTWSAMDSSDKEDSPVPMVFAVWFRDRGTADCFQEKFQKAQTSVVVASPGIKCEN